MIWRRFRFHNGLFLLPFPLLAKRFSNIDKLLVGGLGEIRMRIGAKLFDVAGGTGLRGLPCLDVLLLA